jgi:hypothetical protein
VTRAGGMLKSSGGNLDRWLKEYRFDEDYVIAGLSNPCLITVPLASVLEVQLC